VLVQHPATEVATEERDLWKVLAVTRTMVGPVDVASAALMALDHDVDVATRVPGLYAGLDGGGFVLKLED
jgi:hypothetical protein